VSDEYGVDSGPRGKLNDEWGPVERGAFASEEAFLAALRSGDRLAAEELCVRHLDGVRGVLRSVLGTDSEMEDVVQEVVTRALDGASRFRGSSEQLRGWFTAIAVNTARELIRKRSRFHRWFSFASTETVELVPAHLASVEEIRAVRKTYSVLDSLSTDDRIAFVLRIIEQMTMDQVAEATEVSLSTAKRRVERARRRFELVAKRDPTLSEILEVQP